MRPHTSRRKFFNICCGIISIINSTVDVENFSIRYIAIRCEVDFWMELDAVYVVLLVRDGSNNRA